MFIARYKNPLNTYSRNATLDLFNDFLSSFENSDENSVLVDFRANVNTREDDKSYYLEVDLPGVKKENVDINVDNNILTISGERKIKENIKEENYYSIESSYGKFSRSFTLPQKVDINKIDASCNDGVLQIVIPKIKEVENTKKITIK